MASNTTTEPAEELSIYPNPFSETIHVIILDSFGEEAELVIKDMKGIEVERLTTNAGEAELGKHIGSGVYILQVRSKSGAKIIKIVKTQ